MKGSGGRGGTGGQEGLWVAKRSKMEDGQANQGPKIPTQKLSPENCPQINSKFQLKKTLGIRGDPLETGNSFKKLHSGFGQGASNCAGEP